MLFYLIIMGKKLNSLDDLGGFVFSTNKDFEFDNNDEQQETLANGEQRLEAHLDKKKRVSPEEADPLILLVGVAGFELATPCTPYP